MPFQLHKELKEEWQKPAKNLKKIGGLLDQLKLALTKLVFLPTSNNSASQNELLVAREILEIGAEYSVAVKDIVAFERYMSQLKCYYYDYKNLIADSPNKYQLLGLNLLFLLSQNRVAEFHTELELLPADIIHSNKFIRHPLALEQYFMEGSYNKIFQAKGNVPAESYNFFMDILLDTVRDEIGSCLEQAYEKISLTEASKRLNLKTKEQVKTFGGKKGWKLGGDNFYHFANEAPKPKEPIPSVELAEQAIIYAKELEMIV
ncbi:26S proteasome non-ATPase regulatory subunit 8 [Phlebotomus argentipes]|uniref:26S proteasome non-ATPase regulatory subunit 8 n=1 Tax=Phlebotomus argentipes TaxID=94469 RepID=UPI0028931BD5|nr:26S proteasome non-ATPase regulatory subunit 8 [Phlebotomus argentipes]